MALGKNTTLCIICTDNCRVYHKYMAMFVIIVNVEISQLRKTHGIQSLRFAECSTVTVTLLIYSIYVQS